MSKRIIVDKFNYKEVANEVNEILQKDKNAMVELVCGDKIYYPRACRFGVDNALILQLSEVKVGFVPYDRGYDLKGEVYERILIGDCPDFNLKFMEVLLRVAISEIPEEFKFYYHNILLAIRGFEYCDSPYYNTNFRPNTPSKGFDMIDKYTYNKEKGGFELSVFINQSNPVWRPDEPAFKCEVTGFPVDDEGIELALLETINVLNDKIKEYK